MARKNLLEAFQKVASDAQRREAEGASVAARPAAAVEQAPAVERRPARAVSPAVLALAVAIAFAAGVLVGRSGDGVRAAEPVGATAAMPASTAPTSTTQPPRVATAPDERAPTSAAPRSETLRTEALRGDEPAVDTAGAAFERALLDPANRYTIQVISYANNDAQRQLAGELVAHLRAADLDASDPRPLGRYLVVLVGAAPTEAELRPALDRVRALRDPRGQSGQFADALILPISHFVSR